MIKKIIIILVIILTFSVLVFFFLNQNSSKKIVEKTESVCTTEFKPVCGNDGITYDNTCKALFSGTGVQKTTACEITELSEEIIKNAKYKVITSNEYVELENGTFNNITLFKYAFFDEKIEAAVLLKIDDVFELAIISNHENEPVYWTGIVVEKEVDEIIVQNKTILLKKDSQTILSYKLEGTKLIKQ